MTLAVWHRLANDLKVVLKLASAEFNCLRGSCEISDFLFNLLLVPAAVDKRSKHLRSRNQRIPLGLSEYLGEPGSLKKSSGTDSVSPPPELKYIVRYIRIVRSDRVSETAVQYVDCEARSTERVGLRP